MDEVIKDMKKKLLTILLWILVACMLLPAAADEETLPDAVIMPGPSTSGTTGQTSTETTGQDTTGTTGQTNSGTTGQDDTTGTSGQTSSGTTRQDTTGTSGQTSSETTGQTSLETTNQTTTGTDDETTAGTNGQTTSGSGTESGSSGKIEDKTSEGTKTTNPCAKGHTWGEWSVTEEATCKADGEKTRVCSVCGEKDTKKYSDTKAHQWGDWTVTKAATCADQGVQTRSCILCGKQESQIVPKTGEHAFGEWTVTREPSCLATGLRSRECSVCGKKENEKIDRIEHSWSEWEILKEPTCTEEGKKKRTCDRCGGTEKVKIKALGHDSEEWTVTKEPTCKVVGEKKGACVRCGKQLTRKLNRVDHDFPELVTIEEATDFTKGKQRGECRFCKRVKTVEFYPEGTLAKDLENDPYRVGALQSELKKMGIYKKDPTGQYDNATIEAVRKIQKNLGMKADGVGWPGLIKILLGTEYMEGWDENEGTGPDLTGYKLQMVIKKISPVQETYSAGDELTYEWTLTNTAKAACTKAKIYRYGIDKKGKKQAETAAEEIGTLKPGESVSGTFTYTVTEEDAAAGKIRYGFIVRGNIGGKAASNPHLFMHVNGNPADEQIAADGE